ncbi:sphingosine kinase [Malassezia yamatoensis]|uniref:Sphingosine kinase n=1 Tax=Malassezia yamatoensis TaxID=253288 RepID=A0AAJ5YQH6_9BASI|nr:sphingosine kinase [Malassezia yamatoensis]
MSGVVLEGYFNEKLVTAFVEDALLVVRAEQELVHLPVELVLRASLINTKDSVVVQVKVLAPTPSNHSCSSCVATRSSKSKHILTRKQWQNRDCDLDVARLRHTTISIHVPNKNQAEASAWIDQVQKLAYPHERRQRILVIGNPSSGQGRGKKVLQKQVLPILESAGCTVKVHQTQKRFDAFRIAQTAQTQDYDVLVCVGGDGTMHEVVNGLASRDDVAEAIALPLVPVPCGSGNGMYVSLHGASSFNVPLACLSALKGTTHAQELCAVTQDAALFSNDGAFAYRGQASNGRKYVQYYSFLSQAIGLMADVDLGTEKFRFIGDLRFSLGYVLGAMLNKRCEIDIQVVLGESGSTDRGRMRQRALSDVPSTISKGGHAASARKLRYGSVHEPINPSEEPLELSHISEQQNGNSTSKSWRTVHERVSTLYAGKMPYVARSLMAFPYASPADGAMDILLQTQTSTFFQKIGSLIDGEEGNHVLRPGMHYFKVEALRVTPKKPTRDRYLSIDGESMPYGAFQVEVSRLKMVLLSLDDDVWRAPILQSPAATKHETTRDSHRPQGN